MEADGIAALETFPVGCAVAEFGADGFAAGEGPGAIVGIFGSGMEKRAAGFVGFEIEIEECSDEVLIDGGDAVLAPDGFFEEFALSEGAIEIGWQRIPADIVAGVFVDEHTAIGVD